jgi:NADP-reducing hydrogenase subunit HndB
MGRVKSIEDLKRIREEALQKRQVKTISGQKEIIAGARETLKAILDYIEQENLTDILVRQTGNIGLDSYEPIVQVVIGEQPKITYGKVNPEIAKIIMKQHIVEGVVVKEYAIEA